MLQLPPVAEFSGLTQSEKKALSALPWRYTEKNFATHEDLVCVVVRGHIRYGNEVFSAGGLTGVLPFVVNTSQKVEFLQNAACLVLPTEQLARFFLRNPAGLRAFNGALWQSGRELLPAYEHHPCVLVLYDQLPELQLETIYPEIRWFSIPGGLRNDSEKLLLAWAQYYYEALKQKTKIIGIYSSQAEAELFAAQAAVVLQAQQNKQRPLSPAIILTVNKKNLTRISELLLRITQVCSGQSKVCFIADSGDSWNTQELTRTQKADITIVQGSSALRAAMSLATKKRPAGDLHKTLAEWLQPVYPRRTFYDKKYTENKMRRYWGDFDIAESGFVFAGTSWHAAGELVPALCSALYPPAALETLAENLYQPQNSLPRMLRLGMRQGTYEKGGTKLSLSPQMSSQEHDLYPEKLGRRGIEFLWRAC